jgi:hypothetical protein
VMRIDIPRESQKYNSFDYRQQWNGCILTSFHTALISNNCYTDLIPHLQGQTMQYLVSWCSCCVLNWWGEHAGCYSGGLSELHHKYMSDVQKRLMQYCITCGLVRQRISQVVLLTLK